MKYETDTMPQELMRFSWAAFLWGGIWALGNRVWIGALAFVPLFGFIMRVMLGLRGAEWAWKAGSVTDVERFKRAQRTWVVVWFASLVVIVPLIGVVSALAIYGVRKYIVNAKRMEASDTLAAMASGMASCGSRGDLPETSAWVPPSLAQVSGMKYRSVPGDWAREPAFACAGFNAMQPQYFRYRWLQATNGSGQLEAEADLNGDGVPDETMQLGLHCISGSCVIEPLITGMPAALGR